MHFREIFGLSNPAWEGSGAFIGSDTYFMMSAGIVTSFKYGLKCENQQGLLSGWFVCKWQIGATEKGAIFVAAQYL